jgi:rhamnosyltransferase
MQSNFGNSNLAPRVCAIVVTYHSAPSIIDNVKAIRQQVSELVIVDNGSGEQSGKLLLELEKNPGIRVIRNQKNLGIAAALNIGIRHAAAADYPWVATFDQDSTVTPGFIQTMLATYESCETNDKIAMISPSHCLSEADWKRKTRRGGKPCSKVWVAMTSGCLIKTRALMDNGLYDETMFIDYVDFDFCLRLRERGYQLIRARHAFLLHCLGTLEAHSFLGLTLALTSHNATRCYYIMRNRFLMYLRHGRTFPFWAFNDFIWVLIDFAKIVLFESDKRAKLSQAFKGIRDAFAGVTGPLVSAPA